MPQQELASFAASSQLSEPRRLLGRRCPLCAGPRASKALSARTDARIPRARAHLLLQAVARFLCLSPPEKWGHWQELLYSKGGHPCRGWLARGSPRPTLHLPRHFIVAHNCQGVSQRKRPAPLSSSSGCTSAPRSASWAAPWAPGPLLPQLSGSGETLTSGAQLPKQREDRAKGAALRGAPRAAGPQATGSAGTEGTPLPQHLNTHGVPGTGPRAGVCASAQEAGQGPSSELAPAGQRAECGIPVQLPLRPFNKPFPEPPLCPGSGVL